MRFNYNCSTRKTDQNTTIDWYINNKSSPFLSSRTPIAYYDKETAFLNELFKSIKRSAKKFTQLVSDKKLRGVLTSANQEYKKWDHSKQSWSLLEAEPPSKKK